jgi:hypothetical protein
MLFPGRLFDVADWPESITLGDLDDDGDLDLVAANSGTDDLSVLLNNGDGTYAHETRYAVGTLPKSLTWMGTRI